jgi:isocitrate dehydrogenase (NAD+)
LVLKPPTLLSSLYIRKESWRRRLIHRKILFHLPKVVLLHSESLGMLRMRIIVAGNVGADHAIFEQGASAGNVGNEKLLEQKTANPVAVLLSSAMMLRHLQFPSFADRLETAVKQVISEGRYRTKDLGGSSTTQEVVDAVIGALD